MRTIEVRLQSSELSGAMAEMRMWLDERRCEPSGFSCRDEARGVVVRVNFRASGEAEAFASRFSGHIGPEALLEGGRASIPDVSTALSAEQLVG